ncbi:MAG: flagellar FlbD family protein [Firmicutes bacterium]|nr:flagellar FlbD family protein [Bacillota bacterium]
MIKLTRLNNTVLVVNSELIEFVEETPDTVVTLTTGHKVVVKEPAEEIIKRVVAFKRVIHQELGQNRAEE